MLKVLKPWVFQELEGKTEPPKSKIQTLLLDLGRLNLVFFDFLIERTSGDAKPFRGLFDAATFLGEDSFDVLFFHFQQRQSGVEIGAARTP